MISIHHESRLNFFTNAQECVLFPYSLALNPIVHKMIQRNKKRFIFEFNSNIVDNVHPHLQKSTDSK